MSLSPYPRLWIVGKVVKPEVTVKPVTPIEIAEDDLLRLENLPHENLPNGIVVLPVVAIPTTELSDFTLVTISAFPPEAEML